MKPTAGKTFQMTATTQFGLEEILAEELYQLGAKNIEVGSRAVRFMGDNKLMYEANVWCRTAVRILKPFANFPARDEKDLYRQVQKIDWTEYLSVDSTFAISSVVNQSTFEHSLFVSQLTKDAIADQFRDKFGKRPSVDLDNPDVRINLHMLENRVNLSLDSSGDSLHKRGYRLQTNVAPLNEILAAGIILLTGWDKKTPLYDPMCGSGTLLTEAAMIAHNIAPGLYRHDFGFTHWQDFDEELFKQVIREARQQEDPDNDVPIIGSDIDRDYVEAARNNISSAELDDYIRVKTADFKETQKPEEKGILIVNPPYNERLVNENINELYKMIGDTLKTNYQDWDAYVFTGNLEAAKIIGLKTSRRIPLFNGSIDSRLLKYELYRGSKKEKGEK
jgi:putative N6-adenine-specific DNA methylase